jgi:hypothetical protein
MNGWLTPETIVQIDRAGAGKELIITIEVPAISSCHYPFQLEILGDGTPIKLIELERPGRQEFSVALEQRFLFEFRCSNWLDSKELGLTSIGTRVLGQLQDMRIDTISDGSASYTIVGRDADGWMSLGGGVEIIGSSTHEKLVLSLEIPGWLPFKYPLIMRAKNGTIIIREFEFNDLGSYDIDIPLNKPGFVGLNSDQWFLGSQYGLDYMISYRVVSAKLHSGTRRREFS